MAICQTGGMKAAAVLVVLVPLLSFGGDSGVAVSQLAAILASAHAAGASDDETADRIARIDLTERLTRATLSRLSSGVGHQTALALELLADRSAFLNPPAAEIVPGEPPTPAEQRAIVEKAEAYTLAYVKELPNLVCSRLVSRFDDLAVDSDRELRLRDVLIGELAVRDGAESFQPQIADAVDTAGTGTGNAGRSSWTLTTSGEFGSVLAELFVNHAAFGWRRWEIMDGKRVAVVGYSARRAGSLFAVSWCCKAQWRVSPLGYATSYQPLSEKTAYQGELSIDPVSGAVLRVTQQAVGLPRRFPVKQMRVAVEYLPVTLGGISFLCPARSLSWMEVLSPFTGAYEHYLNRVEFANYQKFATESKLVFDVPAEAPASPLANAPAAPAQLYRAEPPIAVASSTLPDAPPIPEPLAVGEPLAIVPGLAQPNRGLPPPATPVADRETPASTGTQPVFRVRRNEIPVRVVVRDEHGHAVGGLRKEDFELFDEGRLQQISGFRVESRGSDTTAGATTAEAAKGNAAPHGWPVPLRGHYVVFLFDDGNLTLEDLAYARTAAKRAIQDTIEPSTRVALLTVTGKQYVDFTGDLAKLEDALDRIRSQIVPSDTVAASAFAWVNRQTGPKPAADQLGVGVTPQQTPPGTAGYNPESVAFGHTGDYSRFRSLFTNIDVAVNRLAIMPGDRSLVFVSPGFIASDSDQGEYFALIDRAARKGIPISTLDARGLWTLPEFGADKTMVADPYH